MTSRLVSLAAGTVLDVDPAQAVDVAADAGFGAVGLWFDPATWTRAVSTAVARRLRATSLAALDIEPVILGRGEDPGDALVDTAGELGVRHVLVASGPAERGAVVQRFGELCERAAPAGVVVVLEFLPIFTIGTLAAAVAVVEEVGHPNGGVLIDTLAPGPLGWIAERPPWAAARAGAVPAARRRARRATRTRPGHVARRGVARTPPPRRRRAAARRRTGGGAGRPAVARAPVGGIESCSSRSDGPGPGRVHGHRAAARRALGSAAEQMRSE